MAPIADTPDNRAWPPASCFLQRIALDDFVAGNDDRALRFKDTLRQRLQRLVGRFHAGIDAGRASEFNASFRS